MASFWGIEMCEGLESPLSLFMDIRNWGEQCQSPRGGGARPGVRAEG
jgi:hypothetical protein